VFVDGSVLRVHLGRLYNLLQKFKMLIVSREDLCRQPSVNEVDLKLTLIASYTVVLSYLLDLMW
jgi:hypothetical protein